jgi:hypothetical protein
MSESVPDPESFLSNSSSTYTVGNDLTAIHIGSANGLTQATQIGVNHQPFACCLEPFQFEGVAEGAATAGAIESLVVVAAEDTYFLAGAA